MRSTRLATLLYRQLDGLATTLRPSTMNGYRATVRQFLDHLAAAFPSVGSAGQLRRDPHIVGWLEALWSHQPPLSISTRTQRILHMRSLLDALAMDHPEIGYGLLRGGDVPPKDHYLPRPLSIADDRTLQRELQRRSDWPAMALLVLRFSGLRIGELADLSHDCLRQVAPQRWALHVPIGKLHSERWVPVEDSLRELVLRLRFLQSLTPTDEEGAPAPFLLPRPGGGKALMVRLRAYLLEAAQAAGIATRVTPHRLRHTYATEMLRGGVSFPGVMKLLGHTSPEMTLRYVEVSQVDLQREYCNATRQPRHSLPALPVLPLTEPTGGLDAVLRAIQSAQHLLAVLRGDSPFERRLGRLANRLSQIASQLRQLGEAGK